MEVQTTSDPKFPIQILHNAQQIRFTLENAIQLACCLREAIDHFTEDADESIADACAARIDRLNRDIRQSDLRETALREAIAGHGCEWERSGGQDIDGDCGYGYSWDCGDCPVVEMRERQQSEGQTSAVDVSAEVGRDNDGSKRTY